MQRLRWPRSPGGYRCARLLAGASALVVVAACSSSPATPTPGSSGSIASASTGSAQTTIPGAATTLTGTIAAGVESGCFVLVDGQGTVLANLIGLDAASAPVGSTVEVDGRFQPDLMTTCQQGEPFTVASVVVR